MYDFTGIRFAPVTAADLAHARVQSEAVEPADFEMMAQSGRHDATAYRAINGDIRYVPKRWHLLYGLPVALCLATTHVHFEKEHDHAR